jgi:hypothetical protein
MAGNATVTLNYNGKTTKFDVWLQMLSTSSQNEFTTQQTRDGLSWIPIRRQQMTVNFNIAWPLMSNANSYNTNMAGFKGIDPTDGFAKLNRFQDAIRSHQISISNGTTLAPMILNYYNNSDKSSPIFNELISQNPLQPLQYNGWIQSVEKQYVRYQNVFTTQYQMMIVTPNVANTPPTKMEKNFNFSYAPTAQDQLNYGGSWISIGSLASVTQQIIQGFGTNGN